MNDFKWRVWARRVAYFDVFIDFIFWLVVFFGTIFLTGAYIILTDKAHYLNKAFEEVLTPITEKYDMAPEDILFLLFPLPVLCCLIAIFFTRASCSLLSATKLTPKHKDELNTAIEKCRTWQNVNTIVLVFNVLEACWIITTNWGTHNLPTPKALGKGLIHLGVRLGLHYIVGKYVFELKTELSKRKRK